MHKPKGKLADFKIIHGGSVALVVPITPEARRWTAAHIEDDVPRLGTGFAVEPRYLPGLVEYIVEDGLEVQ